jgi:hypothetical protein
MKAERKYREAAIQSNLLLADGIWLQPFRFPRCLDCAKIFQGMPSQWIRGALKFFSKEQVREKWRSELTHLYNVYHIGFLDISKLMEYREPQEDLGLWTRPRAAQRRLPPACCKYLLTLLQLL